MRMQTVLNQTINAELAARKLTKAGMAASMGISNGALYSRLNNSRRWTVDEIPSAAKYLGMDWTQLVNLAADRERSQNEKEASK